MAIFVLTDMTISSPSLEHERRPHNKKIKLAIEEVRYVLVCPNDPTGSKERTWKIPEVWNEARLRKLVFHQPIPVRLVVTSSVSTY